MTSTRTARSLHQRVQRRAEAAFGEHRRVDATGQLAKLVEALRELVLRRGQGLAGGRWILLERHADQGQVEREGDQPLLRAVVQVALEPPALDVPRLDDARARGGELLAGIGVRERLCHQLREVAQPLLEAVRQRLVGPGRRSQRTPQPSTDENRRCHGRLVAGALQRLGEESAGLLVAVDALRAPTTKHFRDDCVTVQIERAAQREAELAILAPPTHDRRGTSAVVAHDACSGDGEKPGHLLGHLTEHAARLHSARDQRGHSAQRRLLVGKRTLGRLARGQRRTGQRALGCLRREHQRRERRDGDEQLGRQQTVGDRVAHERPVVLRGVPDRDRADHEDRRSGSARPEADRCPQQDREDDIGHIALGRELRQRHQDGNHDDALRDLTPVEAPESRGSPGEDERCDHEDARSVPERPGARHLPELVGRDHVAEAQRQRPERGAHHRRDQRGGDERQHVGDPLQPASATRETAHQQCGGHQRDGVPERLGQHRPERRRVVAEEQVANHDRGPQADAVEDEHSETEAGRRPQRRHGAVEVGQLETDAPGEVVPERHDGEREHIDHEARAVTAAQGIDETCAQGLIADAMENFGLGHRGLLPVDQ